MKYLHIIHGISTPTFPSTHDTENVNPLAELHDVQRESPLAKPHDVQIEGPLPVPHDIQRESPLPVPHDVLRDNPLPVWAWPGCLGYSRYSLQPSPLPGEPSTSRLRPSQRLKCRSGCSCRLLWRRHLSQPRPGHSEHWQCRGQRCLCSSHCPEIKSGSIGERLTSPGMLCAAHSFNRNLNSMSFSNSNQQFLALFHTLDTAVKFCCQAKSYSVSQDVHIIPDYASIPLYCYLVINNDTVLKMLKSFGMENH